jgi:hypothetical protein
MVARKSRRAAIGLPVITMWLSAVFSDSGRMLSNDDTLLCAMFSTRSFRSGSNPAILVNLQRVVTSSASRQRCTWQWGSTHGGAPIVRDVQRLK